MLAPWWPVLTEFAIASALGLLILVPVVEFAFKGNAEGLARLLTNAWIIPRSWLVDRSLFHWHRKLNEQRHQRWLLLQQMEALTGEFASSVAELRAVAAETNDPPTKKLMEEQLDKATRQLQVARQNHADGVRGYREMITFELERERYLREGRMIRRRGQSEALAKARKEAVRWVLAFNTADPVGGIEHQHPSGSFEDVDPDDGGFLPLPQAERSLGGIHVVPVGQQPQPKRAMPEIKEPANRPP
jgi:hypothetical protein